jgi:hypothetical protein
MRNFWSKWWSITLAGRSKLLMIKDTHLEIPLNTREAKNAGLLALEIPVDFVGAVAVDVALLH